MTRMTYYVPALLSKYQAGPPTLLITLLTTRVIHPIDEGVGAFG